MIDNKRRKRVIYGIVIGVGFLVLAGVLIMALFVPEAPEVVSLSGFELVGGDNDSLYLMVSLVLNSNTGLGTDMEEFRYTVFLDDTSAAGGSWSGSQYIPGEGEFTIDLPVGIDEEEIPLWLEALCNEDSIELGISCDLLVDTPLLNWNLHFDVEEKVWLFGLLDKLLLREAYRMSPWVTNIETPSIGLLSTRIDVTLSFRNSYPFPISITSVDLNFGAGGSTLGNLSSTESVLILPGEETELTVRLTGSYLSPVIAAIGIVRERELAYSLSGTVVVQVGSVEVSLPIKKEDSLSLGL
jgi:LEA14-like dessication related protein